MKKKVWIVLMCLAYYNGVLAQKPLFLNSNQSLVALNPSFAGSNGMFRNQASYSRLRLYQPVTEFCNSADIFIPDLRGGFSVSYYSNNAAHGPLHHTKSSFAYAQYISLSESRLVLVPSVQLSLGAGLYNDNWIDPVTGRPTPSSPHSRFIDASPGLLLRYERNLNLGVSVFHLTQRVLVEPQTSYRPLLPRTFNFHGAYTFYLSDINLLQVFARHMRSQKFNMTQLSANMVIRNHLIAGAGYATGDDVVQVNSGYRANVFSVVLGYNQSLFNGTGSWELYAAFNLRNKESRRSLTCFENM